MSNTFRSAPGPSARRSPFSSAPWGGEPGGSRVSNTLASRKQSGGGLNSPPVQQGLDKGLTRASCFVSRQTGQKENADWGG
eukprot:6987879-Pyramimonas_sp.AAC.1